MLQGYVTPLLAEGCDTLILGCTHYPFLRPLLSELVPASVSLIDTGAAVARQLQRLLAQHEMLATEPAQATRYWSSGKTAQLCRVLPILLSEEAEVRSI